MPDAIPTALPDDPTQSWQVVDVVDHQATVRIALPTAADSDGIPVLLEHDPQHTVAAPTLLASQVHQALLRLCLYLDTKAARFCVGSPDIFRADEGSARAVSVKLLVRNHSRFKKELTRAWDDGFYALLVMTPAVERPFTEYFLNHLAKVVETLPPLPDTNCTLLEF